MAMAAAVAPLAAVTRVSLPAAPADPPAVKTALLKAAVTCARAAARVAPSVALLMASLCACVRLIALPPIVKPSPLTVSACASVRVISITLGVPAASAVFRLKLPKGVGLEVITTSSRLAGWVRATGVMLTVGTAVKLSAIAGTLSWPVLASSTPVTSSGWLRPPVKVMVGATAYRPDWLPANSTWSTVRATVALAAAPPSTRTQTCEPVVVPRRVRLGVLVVSRSSESTLLSPVTGRKLSPAAVTVCELAAEAGPILPAVSLALAVSA